ncbi:MAG: fibronectin type III domain-containing protein [Verrucomicrobia bacterium]|nr:fibronectin type III domain-containing protein [Verrucomicrobiota bacterium]
MRAVQAGKKGAFPASVPAVAGLAADTVAPAAVAVTGQALHATKVTLSWAPATENHAVNGYKVYRDGVQIADVAAAFNSWMDNAVQPNTSYIYSVKAYDMAGNLSPDGTPAMIKTLP